MARTVLHDGVAAPEMNSSGVIKLQPNFAVVHDSIVNGVSPVHCGIFFFEVIGQSSETNQSLFAGSVTVKRRVRKDRAWRKFHEVKTCAARSRHDRVRIAVKPLLLGEVRDRGVDPNERVLVAGDVLNSYAASSSSL